MLSSPCQDHSSRSSLTARCLRSHRAEQSPTNEVSASRLFFSTLKTQHIGDRASEAAIIHTNLAARTQISAPLAASERRSGLQSD
eukprot:1938608-Rhodomonas_salina.1